MELRGTSITVFCGSSPGANPAYLEAARALGASLAQQQVRVIYGGASVGLMGAVADAALAGGAEVIGVLPSVLAGREIAHNGLTTLERVPTMHKRIRTQQLSQPRTPLP